MNKIYFIILCSVFFNVNVAAQKTYFFSSSEGNDTNVGTQENSPFKTIDKLNALILSPGDKVYFKKGDTFIGQLNILYSGSDSAPIVYDSYGTGSKPILTASDGDNGVSDPMSTIKIIGKEYLEFHNLQIENERFDAEQGSDNDKSFGIYISSFKTLPNSGNFEDRDLHKHFRFTNLHFQNIYAINSTSTEFNQIRTTGIYFLDAFVNDVIVENCYFTDIERTGIWLRKYVSDAIIRNNKFIDIGGSGTIISVSKRVLYENNIMRFTGSDSDERMTARGSGMWVFGSDDVVAQYNVSQHARGDGDSSGMHVDYGNTNILYQYNYLEDSAGGFCETLGNNINVIWRYNVSVNEGTDDKGGKNKLLWVNDYAYNRKKSEQVYIYNNTIYQGTDYQNSIGNSRIELKAKDIYFYNNILYLESAAKLGIKSYSFDVDTPNFKKNVLYGGSFNTAFKNLDITRREFNPRLIAPGRRHFSGYKILSYSPVKGDAFSFVEPQFPLAGQGVFSGITSKATKDIYGNQVDLLSSTNIGADNGDGEATTHSLMAFEAENALLTGGSEVACVNASGGKAINVTAADSSLIFDEINISETDAYLIKVYYLNPLLSELKMTINAGEEETVMLPYSNGFCYQSGTPTSFHLVRTLNAGINSIEFKQSVIDKIEVISIQDATLGVDTIFPMSRSEVYLEKTVLSNNDWINVIVKNKEITNQNFLELSCFDITGKQLTAKKFTSNQIRMAASSLGKGLKILTIKIGAELIVKKIVVH